MTVHRRPTWLVALVAFPCVIIVLLLVYNIWAWAVITARDESLLRVTADAEHFVPDGTGEALSVLYITHRHRLCVDFGADGWDAAVPPGTALALRGLRNSGVTVGVPCRSSSQIAPSLLRCTDVVSLTITRRGQGSQGGQGSPEVAAIATSVPGASKILLIYAAVYRDLPASVDAALAKGMRVVVEVADEVTECLVQDMAWVAGWGSGITVTRHQSSDADGTGGRVPLVDMLDAVNALRPQRDSRTLRCVALWISPDNEIAFSDAPQLRGRKLAFMPYDACFDAEAGDNLGAKARLNRRRPLAYTAVVDTQMLLPMSSRGVDTRRRLLTCLMSPVVLYVPRITGVASAEANPLVALVVRHTASAAASGADGATDSRTAERASLAQNTAIALHLPMLPSTAAWMTQLGGSMAMDMVVGQGHESSYSIYDTNGGPLDAAGIPRRAVLEQWSGDDGRIAGEGKRAHLTPDWDVPGFLVSITDGRRVFETDSRWIGGVRLQPGDHVLLGHQWESRENGRYIVTRGHRAGGGARMASAALGTYVPSSVNTTGMAEYDADETLLPHLEQVWTLKAPRGTIRDPEPDLLEAGDAVWLTNVDAGGSWGEVGNTVVVPATGGMLFVDAEDKAQQDKFAVLARCVTDPTIAIQQECEAQPGGVWDRPCVTDTDCPFFQKNKHYRNYRGGCDVAGSGYCEMPIGVKQLSYRKYDAGVASRPLCYGCEESADQDACCGKQGDFPDFAFLGDLQAHQIPRGATGNNKRL